MRFLLQHLQNYLDTCQECKDSEGIGKACEAIAKAYDRLVNPAMKSIVVRRVKIVFRHSLHGMFTAILV